MIARRALLVLALASCATTAGALAIYAGRPTAGRRSGDALALPELARWFNLAGRIVVRSAEDSFTLERIDRQWVVVEKVGYPTRPGLARDVLLALSELRLVEPRTTSPEFYRRIGVEDAESPGARSLSVTVESAAGAVLGELIVGRRRLAAAGGRSARYVRRPREHQAWLALGGLEIPGTALDWIDPALLNVPVHRIRDVVIEGGDRPPLVLRRDAPSADFSLVDAPAGRTVDQTQRLALVAGALQGLTLEDVRPAALLTLPVSGPLASFATFDGLLIVVQRAVDPDRPSSPWIGLGAASPPGSHDAVQAEAAALKARFADRAFAVAPAALDRLFARVEDLTVPTPP